MIYATMLAGKLGWNLAQRLSHRAGDILQFTATITNTTDTLRQYRVWIGLFTLEGTVITTFPLPDYFNLLPQEEAAFLVSAKIDYSDCIMQASLYDIETGEMGAALQTILEQPPSTIEQVSPIFGIVGAVLALGIVASFVPKMLKG